MPEFKAYFTTFGGIAINIGGEKVHMVLYNYGLLESNSRYAGDRLSTMGYGRTGGIQLISVKRSISKEPYIP